MYYQTQMQLIFYVFFRHRAVLPKHINMFQTHLRNYCLSIVLAFSLCPAFCLYWYIILIDPKVAGFLRSYYEKPNSQKADFERPKFQKAEWFKKPKILKRLNSKAEFQKTEWFKKPKKLISQKNGCTYFFYIFGLIFRLFEFFGLIVTAFCDSAFQVSALRTEPICIWYNISSNTFNRKWRHTYIGHILIYRLARCDYNL